ncbi:MAG: transcription antitermination factor NusB [Kiritimatiellia bacterium]
MRRQAREAALQILYRLDLNPGNPDVVLGEFRESNGMEADVRSFAERLVRGVRENMESLDRLISGYARNWELHRMSAVDRNVMRMALYEMLKCPDVPPVVSINEAVDIAKYFGTAESGKFVNGILDRAGKDLKRPGREALPLEGAGGSTE